jgi:hypothetical protein
MYKLLSWGYYFGKFPLGILRMVEGNIKMHLSDGWLVDKGKLGSCPLVKLEYREC